MAKTKVTLNQGSYSYEDAAIKVTGNVTLNDKKEIQNINGQVVNGELNIGSFDAFRNGENLQFNVHFSDPAVADTLTGAVSAAVDAVKAEL